MVHFTLANHVPKHSPWRVHGTQSCPRSCSQAPRSAPPSTSTCFAMQPKSHNSAGGWRNDVPGKLFSGAWVCSTFVSPWCAPHPRLYTLIQNPWRAHRAAREAVLRFLGLLHHRLHLVCRVAQRVVPEERARAQRPKEQRVAERLARQAGHRKQLQTVALGV